MRQTTTILGIRSRKINILGTRYNVYIGCGANVTAFLCATRGSPTRNTGVDARIILKLFVKEYAVRGGT
jgi:hypothetical protein